jgi:hypothetical protein
MYEIGKRSMRTDPETLCVRIGCLMTDSEEKRRNGFIAQDTALVEKMNRIIDLGCGSHKVEGAIGVDKHPYPGVDKIVDLDVTPWPLDSDSFETIYAHHVIEHVVDIPLFMNEIHRIGSDGAMVYIVTPHFSSVSSWGDPTHRWHLSCVWHETFTKLYLSEQIARFEYVSSEVGFARRSARSLIPRLMIALKGLDWLEKHYAFVYRARNIRTVLRIRKASQ